MGPITSKPAKLLLFYTGTNIDTTAADLGWDVI